MILTGEEIKKQVLLDRIHIIPFSADDINPNSYNYHLGDTILEVTNSVLDSKCKTSCKKIQLTEKGHILKPNKLYLGSTCEQIGSDHYVTTLIGRSSVGRLGLFLQITADLGHTGSKHCWTLELHVVQPLRVYPGMKIGQVSFWEVLGKKGLNNYKGTYQKFSKPKTSEFHNELS